MFLERNFFHHFPKTIPQKTLLTNHHEVNINSPKNQMFLSLLMSFMELDFNYYYYSV